MKTPPQHIQDALYQALDYDPATGELRWREDRRRSREGDLAGSISRDGAIVVGFLKKVYQASHIAWFLHTGDWPYFQIRFNDNNPTNLHADNLALQKQVYVPGSKAQQAREYRARQKAKKKLLKPTSTRPNVTYGAGDVWSVRSLREAQIVLASFKEKNAAEDYADLYAYGFDYVYRNRAATFPKGIAEIPAGGPGALTLQEASERFAYDPDTGAIFRRRIQSRKTDTQGTPAIELDDNRRPIVRASGRTYTAGMMAWFLHTGDWPKRKQLGYRDDDPKNTRLANLYLKGSEQ